MVVGDVATGTEVLVVGGGPGGYAAAIRAAQLGNDVTLVEKDQLGGTCLNRGCIPTKALLSATGIAARLEDADDIGIEAEVTLDTEVLFGWKDSVVQQLTTGVESLCEGNGVTFLDGTATFVDEHTARIAHGGGGQGSETLEFEHAIIATGSRQAPHPAIELPDEDVWTPGQALERDDNVDNLVIIGSGYIAVELATIFARTGTNVDLLVEDARLVPKYASDIADILADTLEETGIDLYLDRTIVEAESTSDGIEIIAEDSDPFTGDKTVLAGERQPVTEALDLDELGVETNEKGCVETDEYTRTTLDHIYAVGDVSGEPFLAHHAICEGVVAAGAIAGEHVAMDRIAIPSVIYTDPEIATVGLTEEEAADAGYAPVVGTMSMRASGRAITLNDMDGFVKVVADADTGFVLGGQIVAPHAAELIGELTLAIELAATLEDIERTIHAHPTLSEAIEEAALQARGRAIHTLNR